MQTVARSRDVATVHYDLGNEFFEPWLDPRMVYSCGYWKGAANLAQAQENKLDLVCRKLRLAPGHRVLDIGCGWGSFVCYAAERYGCQCVGVTIAERQAEYAAWRCSGLPVTIHACDYRKTPGERATFDRVVSIGMFEHVGPDNYGRFFETIDHLMTNDGLALVHTIGDNVSRKRCDPWLNKYIFPNGVAPSIQQLGAAIEGRFVVEDWHNFGPDYFATFMSWYEGFKTSWEPGRVRTAMAPDSFYRMWEYYLSSFASAFKVRDLHVWQIVLSKQRGVDAYESVR
jgi:cyclopropane-fatty-acyl-phospholipid synthase